MEPEITNSGDDDSRNKEVLDPVQPFNGELTETETVDEPVCVEPSNDENIETATGDKPVDVESSNDGNTEIVTVTEHVDAKVNEMNEEEVDTDRYWSLMRALRMKNWKSVEEFIKQDPDQALTAKISISKQTLLHLMIRLSAPISLLEKLVKASESLNSSLRDDVWQSEIFTAAQYGNTKAAKAIVRRNQKLPNTRRTSDNCLPIHVAAMSGQKETTQYLLKVTTEALDDNKGVELLGYLINFSLYGIAFDLLKKYPKLARDTNKDRGSILASLANKPMAFESGSSLGHWEYLIYHLIPVSLKEHDIPHPESVCGDIENPGERPETYKKSGFLQRIYTACVNLSKKLPTMLLNALMQIVPRIKDIREMKLKHMQTHEIVKMMCEGICWNMKNSWSLREPLFAATKLGIYEIVSEILNAYFYAYRLQNNEKYYFYDLAFIYRHENIFNLIYDYTSIMLVPNLREKKENKLHLAGRLMPSSQVSGAALQMQREFQWFKAAESMLHPSFQEQQNPDGQTPREYFSQQHEKLVKEGEKWMKNTASSSTVAAALIVTIVFTAAFTVPGGNDSSGIPNFLHEPIFVIFALSDAFALFFSTTSVLMFLGILTSRYGEEDFLVSLPRKLIIGLITLFLSIATMMIAFGAAIYIVISPLWSMVFIPIAILGGLTVILFAEMQFPLLFEMYLSTYRSSLYQPNK